MKSDSQKIKELCEKVWATHGCQSALYKTQWSFYNIKLYLKCKTPKKRKWKDLK